MADVVMPEQIIKDTYGEIPDELINVEKLLEEAGLSRACQASHREQPKCSIEKDLNSLIDGLIVPQLGIRQILDLALSNLSFQSISTLVFTRS